MEGSKAVGTPGTTEGQRAAEGGEKEEDYLVGQRATRYRRMVARLNYLAQDRPNLSFAVKEVARTMASPRAVGEVNLKRIVRYLRGAEHEVYLYRWQQHSSHLTCQVDSDWAGCTRARRSTSGGALFRGRHLLAHWSRTQATVALSSGEAEFYGTVKASGTVLGLQALMEDLGWTLPVRCRADSAASMRSCKR